MEVQYYKDVIKSGSVKAIGVALGKAIKDNKINPETYAALCKEAKMSGFKFRYIEFQND